MAGDWNILPDYAELFCAALLKHELGVSGP